ncbi:MAG: hypothetical protein FJX45_12230 [Alphaproteobacteria bacterium]|nr:hypothetical protein [Alphaproteobacteria bacterium]
MMITLEIDNRAISNAVEGERIELAKRVRLATENTGYEKLTEPLREMTREALNSRKMPTTWREKLYPEEARHTLTPAFFVYSLVPQAMVAFEEGATITPIGGKKYLWIPTENVPRGKGGARFTPKKILIAITRPAETKGRGKDRTTKFFDRAKFKIIPLKGGGFIVLGAANVARRRSHKRGGNRIGANLGYGGAKTVEFNSTEAENWLPFYILKKQVKLRKRLNIASIVDRAGAKYAANYERAANAS